MTKNESGPEAKERAKTIEVDLGNSASSRREHRNSVPLGMYPCDDCPLANTCGSQHLACAALVGFMRDLRSWDILPRKPDRERYRKLFDVSKTETTALVSVPVHKIDDRVRPSPQTIARVRPIARKIDRFVPVVVTEQPLLDLPKTLPGSLEEQIALYETAIIVKAVRDSRCCIAGAARRLQIGSQALRNRMKRLGIQIQHKLDAEETAQSAPSC